MNCLNEYCSVYELIYCTLKSKIFYYIYSRTIHVIIYSYKIVTYYNPSGENSQMSRFGKICGKLALFQKYLAIYHFFSTQVPQNQVLNSTQVQWTWVPSELPAWYCWPRICVIKKNNVILDTTEIEYLFIVLKLSAVEYLVFLFFSSSSFFFFFFSFFYFLFMLEWLE